MDLPAAPGRELRLAVVLYGGVSLAVYLNGVCQELVRLVLATSPHEEHRRLAGPVGDVYRRAAGDGHVRVVIDVLTGSSAGGINAVLAASGLRHGTTIDSTGDLWVELADLEALAAGGSRRGSHRPPRALLDGDVMLAGVHDALLDLAGRSTTPASDALDCYVTATDLGGVPDDVDLDDGQVVHERHHRAVFHFAFGRPDSTGGHRDDLDARLAPLQAFACRATAAHPVAFEPARFTDALAHLASTEDAARLRAALAQVVRGADELVGERWFSDGGDMDNKPFSYTLEPLRRRRATVPVTRRLVFADPSPAQPSATPLEAPGWVPHIVRAVGLGRQERIVDDIERIRTLNRSIESYAAAVRAGLVALDPVDPSELDDDRRPHLSSWHAATAADLRAAPGGVGRLAYERRRVELLTDDLASLLTRRLHDTPALPEPPSVRAAVAEYLAPGGDLALAEDLGHRAQLARFDLAYRLRRLDLLDHVLSLVADGDPSVARWSDGVEPSALSDVRARLNVSFLDLWSLGRHLGDDPARAHDERRAATRHGQQLVALGTPPPPGAEDGHHPAGPDVRPELDHVLHRELDRVAVIVAPWFARTSLDARAAIRSPALPPALRAGLSAVWVRFDELDQLLLPLHADAAGELAPIGIRRVSPVDATRLLGAASDAHHKLAGRTLANFGGFVDRSYRRNDLLWGRLDAAETVVELVASVAGSGPRPELIDAAHDAVLTSVLALDATPEPSQRDITDRLAGTPSGARAVPGRPPERARLARLAERLVPVAAQALVHRPTSGPSATDASRLRVARRVGTVVSRRLSLHLMGRRSPLVRAVVAAAMAAFVAGAVLGGRARVGWIPPLAFALALAGAAVAVATLLVGRWVLPSAGFAALVAMVAVGAVVAAVTGAWPLTVGAAATAVLMLFLPLRWFEGRIHAAVQRVDDLFGGS